VTLNPKEILTLMGDNPAHHDSPVFDFDERETTNMVLEVWMRIISLIILFAVAIGIAIFFIAGNMRVIIQTLGL